MSYENANSLVDTAWVAEHLDDPKVRILDGSYHLAATGRDAKAEYAAGHIPGAIHFDIDTVCDPNPTPSPHMFPSNEEFASAVGAMGISNDTRVVVYDADGLFCEPRVWWMFRVFGHENVAVMTGGFRNWVAEGRPVTTEVPSPPPASFSAHRNDGALRSIEQMLTNVRDGRELVLDARAPNRFAGSEPEARPGVEPGHIPGAVNLPYAEIVDAESGTFRDADTLIAAFDRVGADGSRPVATSCGSGVTACILGLGMHLIGRDNWALYDGSWTEWGGNPDTPKAKGAE
ncbi:MAG: 3-mercaptopyruvate sulfurtransferase [Alphaproteobacteria bacterium]|nr:3-mercaptopyruvate sulfurtransferase [Alphaproteobacteria bacterium]